MKGNETLDPLCQDGSEAVDHQMHAYYTVSEPIPGLHRLQIRQVVWRARQGNTPRPVLTLIARKAVPFRHVETAYYRLDGDVVVEPLGTERGSETVHYEGSGCARLGSPRTFSPNLIFFGVGRVRQTIEYREFTVRNVAVTDWEGNESPPVPLPVIGESETYFNYLDLRP